MEGHDAPEDGGDLFDSRPGLACGENLHRQRRKERGKHRTEWGGWESNPQGHKVHRFLRPMRLPFRHRPVAYLFYHHSRSMSM